MVDAGKDEVAYRSMMDAGTALNSQIPTFWQLESYLHLVHSVPQPDRLA